MQELQDFGQYQDLLNCQTMAFCLSFSCNVIGYFKKALKSDLLVCFSGWERDAI